MERLKESTSTVSEDVDMIRLFPSKVLKIIRSTISVLFSENHFVLRTLFWVSVKVKYYCGHGKT